MAGYTRPQAGAVSVVELLQVAHAAGVRAGGTLSWAVVLASDRQRAKDLLNERRWHWELQSK